MNSFACGVPKAYSSLGGSVAAAFTPGEETFFASDSPTSSFSGVFEDNGQTGYFYAYDRAAPRDARILDACHIYNVANVVDRDRPSRVEVIWTNDGMKAALLINDAAHAVVDFGARRAYCRTNFPPPTGPWKAETRVPWDDALLAVFHEADA
jgi:hypothetical protein